MNNPNARPEYLVISRGQWDKSASPEEIQKAIDDFYIWIGELVDQGKMKPGQRLANQGRTVSKKGVLTDGPYGESKEVVGGYWFIVADTLDEAAKIIAGNPTMRCGLFFEVRPIEQERASAFVTTTETPRG
ncbi:MAG TPA: YciI family protein [Candidatus Acidoferrum sp.]|nr:YciI family protein [Candidatus Acidoferrum sp.]